MNQGELKILEDYNKIINSDEFYDLNKLDLSNLYKLKEYMNEKKLKTKDEYILPSQLIESGVILSYGEGEDFIPAGVYGISRYVDRNNKVITDKVDSILDVMIEFTEVEYVDSKGMKKKTNGSKIYIPYLEFVDIYKKYTSNNSIKLSDMMVEEPDSLELLAFFEKIAEDYMGENSGIHSYETINFEGENMEKIGGIFENNKSFRGTNFKVIPFAFGKIKKLINKKSNENYAREYYGLQENDETKVRVR